MVIRIRRVMPPAPLALLVSAFILTSGSVSAQQPDGRLSGNIKYNSGQSVQPIFEGWSRNPDGSFQLWFGYLNRNHVQEIHVAVGNDNKLEPGGPDRGQPTYFYPRFNRQLFSVPVPRDFGEKQQVVWTLVANGQSERAVGWLRPDWEIATPGSGTGSGRGGENTKNVPPTLTVAAAQPRIKLSDSLALTATVTDDGVPPLRTGRGRGSSANRAPAFDNPTFKGQPPTNVPQVERAAPPRVNARLQVNWFVWRGPGSVTFAPPAASADEGKATFTATFSKPGEYVLRARALDGAATTQQDLKVVVEGS